jgi:hypothetical protein
VRGNDTVTGPGNQRGFINWLISGVAALIVLGLAGQFVYWVATEENFAQVVAILWAMGFGLAYFFTVDNQFIARMPVGFAVFLVITLAALPLTWAAGSRIALVVLIAAQVAFSFQAGQVLSGRLRTRYPEGAQPKWLRNKGDVVADFGHWVLLAFAALIYLLVAPLFVTMLVSVVVDLSTSQVKWTIATWGLLAILWAAVRARSARWLGVPMCAWIYLGVTAVLIVADALRGPFATGTGVQVAYTVMPGALIAAFVEVFVLGGGRISKKEEAK